MTPIHSPATPRARHGLMRRLGRQLAAAALLGCATMASALAQGDWPAKPIRFIVGFPPGSSPDVVARALSPGLTQALRQPVVVENRAGVTGMIAAEAVARAPNDGYTFLVTSGSAMSISVHTLPRVPINPDKDLVPVAAAARIELFLVSDARQPFGNFREFMAYAKANPGKLTYGSPGTGSAPHVATEMLRAQSGINVVHVPYRGASPALQDLLGGTTQFLFDPGIALEHVRAGRLRLLAVGSTKRSPLFPDTPTIQELGMADFDAGTTHGIYAAAGTPPATVNRLNAEINKLLAQPQVAQQFTAIGAEATPMSAAEFGALIRRDSARYGAIVRERGIKE
ncbi:MULTISPECIES: tripartite tricarboxylate transporter substrate binding protein [unclassified Hydrogenophaga]|uniref:Bug family tripartite tricarboxylate transporter substrate binding protein n=1 Tax=unclassified Hydrogenophaga TaxID=2610897 RepID=UPI0009670A91|nr:MULTISPECIES: tripartite tricarboxylate transporter substrate binding protein [unclassified Hydrogenophaga]OJV68438.1 MAG: ABC transporter substrate-binding protein [Hydrogenophaga sp. 70-12]